jgi:DNA-binding MarR family transcriptional regulator
MSRSGAELALLLLGGFRAFADRATVELAARGYEDVRPVHDFALQAILSGADNVSELGRRMSVTKQSAAKTIAVLEERGFVAREPDPTDRRRMRLRVTDHGLAMLREGEAIFNELRGQWEAQVGAAAVGDLEGSLRRLLGTNTIRLDKPPGWLVQDLGGDD